jgi:histidinol phosphatase-like PHP family hydrolase
MDDVYPSAEFRTLLRERGVRFVLSSDSHSPDTIDCAFGRFAAAEEYIASPLPALCSAVRGKFMV